jgi:hypothetical protein
MVRGKYLTGVSDKVYKDAAKYMDEFPNEAYKEDSARLAAVKNNKGKTNWSNYPEIIKYHRMLDIIHKEEVARLFLMYDHPDEYKEWDARWKNEINTNFPNNLNNNAASPNRRVNNNRTASNRIALGPGSNRTHRRRAQRKRAAQRKKNNEQREKNSELIERQLLEFNNNAY